MGQGAAGSSLPGGVSVCTLNHQVQICQEMREGADTNLPHHLPVLFQGNVKVMSRFDFDLFR